MFESSSASRVSSQFDRPITGNMFPNSGRLVLSGKRSLCRSLKY